MTLKGIPRNADARYWQSFIQGSDLKIGLIFKIISLKFNINCQDIEFNSIVTLEYRILKLIGVKTISSSARNPLIAV